MVNGGTGDREDDPLWAVGGAEEGDRAAHDLIGPWVVGPWLITRSAEGGMVEEVWLTQAGRHDLCLGWAHGLYGEANTGQGLLALEGREDAGRTHLGICNL